MASKFWISPAVTGAANNGSGLIRITTASTTGWSTGETRIISGVLGTTEANGTWTITVISGTTFDLQSSTFTNVYVSGGVIASGQWNATNTANWASTTGGSGGAPVPTINDTVNFDGSSGGGTTTVNTDLSIGLLILTGHTGTLDFSVNNNNITMVSGFSRVGSSTSTLNMGNGNWTINATSGGTWNLASVTGFTLICGSSNLIFNAVLTSPVVPQMGAGQTYSTITVVSQAGIGISLVGAGSTIGTLVLTGPVNFSFGSTWTITNALNINGSSANFIYLTSNGSTITISSGAFTWVIAAALKLSGATVSATNSYSMGGNTNVSVTNPSGGSSGPNFIS
jgi:hypothetical protein